MSQRTLGARFVAMDLMDEASAAAVLATPPLRLSGALGSPVTPIATV